MPKLIHPLPPPVNSPESSPERGDATWMQVRINLFLLLLISSWGAEGKMRIDQEL